MFSAGGIRIGEAAQRIWSGEASKVLGHATSGPALQQNLVCTMAKDGALMGKQPAAVIGVGQTHHRAKREDVSMAGPVP